MNETTTPPAPPHTGVDSFFDAIRRTGLVRTEERWIGGVAGGLALRLRIDPAIIRGLLGVTVLLGGLGLVVYGVGWLLLPEQRDGRIHLQQLFRGDFDAAVLGGFALFLVGIGFRDTWVPFTWMGGGSGWWRGLLWLSAVAVVVALVIAATTGRGSQPRPPLPTEGPTMYPAPTSLVPPTAYPMTTAYPVAPTALPRPVRPVTRGPGAAGLGVVVALGLLVLAGLLYAERVDAFDGPVLLTAGSVMVILAGLGIVVAGLFGRSSGGLGALAIMSCLALVPIAAVDYSGWGATTAVGDGTYTPRDVAAAEHGYSIGVGDVELNLTDVPVTGPVVAVPVHLGAGDLTVVLPEGGAYTARVRVMAGQLTWLDDVTIDGVGSNGWRTFESPAVQDGATPDIQLEVTVGAGTLRVVEES